MPMSSDAFMSMSPNALTEFFSMSCFRRFEKLQVELQGRLHDRPKMLDLYNEDDINPIIFRIFAAWKYGRKRSWGSIF